MNLQSERLSLREITQDDHETLHKLNSTPEIDEYNTLGIPKDIETTKKVYQPILDDQKSETRKLFK